MDVELKWPVTRCEACDYNLREKTPKTGERSNVNGRPNWTDFCPQCGHGYVVAERVLPTPPAEVLAEMEAKPALSFVEELKPEPKPEGKPSLVPPDKRGAALAAENPDPEGQIQNEPGTPVDEANKTIVTPEPGAVRSPGEGEYFCTKCAGNHKDTDKPKSIGLRHKKFREA